MKWLPIVLLLGLVGWLWWKKKPVTTAATAAGLNVTSNPGVPTTPTPTNTVIMTDAVNVKGEAICPTPEAIGGAIQTALNAGQTKVVYNSADPITVDVPSVVAAAASSGQTVTEWLQTQFAYQPYSPLPTDPVAKAAVIQTFTDVKASGLAKLAAGGGWDSLTAAEHSACAGTPIETWQAQYAGV